MFDPALLSVGSIWESAGGVPYTVTGVDPALKTFTAKIGGFSGVFDWSGQSTLGIQLVKCLTAPPDEYKVGDVWEASNGEMYEIRDTVDPNLVWAKGPDGFQVPFENGQGRITNGYGRPTRIMLIRKVPKAADSPNNAPRFLPCTTHAPVNTGFGKSWCSSCNADMHMVGLEWVLTKK